MKKKMKGSLEKLKLLTTIFTQYFHHETHCFILETMKMHYGLLSICTHNCLKLHICAFVPVDYCYTMTCMRVVQKVPLPTTIFLLVMEEFIHTYNVYKIWPSSEHKEIPHVYSISQWSPTVLALWTSDDGGGGMVSLVHTLLTQVELRAVVHFPARSVAQVLMSQGPVLDYGSGVRDPCYK